MPSEISVGVMGLGIMGTGHLDNLVKMPDVSVTALWISTPPGQGTSPARWVKAAAPSRTITT